MSSKYMGMNPLDAINKMAFDLGLFPRRRKNRYIFWRIPKGWHGGVMG